MYKKSYNLYYVKLYLFQFTFNFATIQIILIFKTNNSLCLIIHYKAFQIILE